jgi:citrate lyase subunit beta / citryl-CoA lyase
MGTHEPAAHIPGRGYGHLPAIKSCLSVPASENRKVRRALASAADLVIIDFEDSIPPDGKQEARALAVAILTESSELQNGRRLIAIRINAAGSQWFLADVLAVVGLDAVSGVVVPKVEGAGDLGTMDAVLASAEAARGRARSLRTYALIETAGGLAAAGDIARASDRLVALIPGYADLGASLGRSGRELGSDYWMPVQSAIVVAARAAQRMVIDGPWLGVEDSADFQAALRRSRAIGFDGAWVLHPAQVATANSTFAPTPGELARAHQIIQAMKRAHAAGVGALQLDGQMIDEAVVKWAMRTVGSVPS